MRLFLLGFLIFTSLSVFAQKNYDCFNEPSMPTNWDFLGPKNKADELMHQRFGQVSCFSVNPKDSNEIFAGSPTGALFHTTNRGQRWTALTDKNDLPIIGINDIIVDYSQRPYHILIATGCNAHWFDLPVFGIFKSTDGGKSWQRKETNQPDLFSNLYLDFKQYRQTIFARAKNNIIKSINQGETWTTLLDKEKKIGGIPLKERNIRYFYYEPTFNKLYFSTSQKYISTGNEDGKLYVLDLGSNKITELTPPLNKVYATEAKGNGIEAIQIVPMSKNKLMFGVSHYKSRETFVFYYDLQTQKVTDYEVPNGSSLGVSLFWFSGFRINNQNPNIRYIADIYVYKSVDGGQTYKRLFGYSLGDNNVPHVDVRSIKITHHSADGESDHIYIGTDGGLSFSNNGGKTWRNLNGPEFQLTQFYGMGSSPFTGVVSAGSQDNSIISYLPYSKKWLYNVRGDGYDVAYSQTKPKTAYGQYNVRALGASYNDIVPFNGAMRLGGTDNSNNRKTLYAHKNGDLYFAGQSLFHLPKGSKKWKEYKTPLTHHALTLAVSETNPNIIYMTGLWSDLVKTTDGGTTWEKIASPVIDGRTRGERIHSICISPYDEDKIWIGLGYMGSYNSLCDNTPRVLESNDGGRTWTNISRGLPIFSIQDLAFYHGTYESLFAATPQGIYYRQGTGYKWQRMAGQLPNTLISELNINYCRGKLLVATFGRGLWETDLPPITQKNVEIISGVQELKAPEGEAIVLKRDLKLRRRARLIISSPVHLPKGGKISVRRKKQIIFAEGGKLVNACSEELLGIEER